MAAGALLAGCGTHDALVLARQSCAHVQRAAALYRAGAAASDQGTAQADNAAGLTQLRQALPLAATAAGESAQWEALATTLSESADVPGQTLLGALEEQCADATAGGVPVPTTGPGVTGP